jgi:hypothetical protein
MESPRKTIRSPCFKAGAASAAIAAAWQVRARRQAAVNVRVIMRQYSLQAWLSTFSVPASRRTGWLCDMNGLWISFCRRLGKHHPDSSILTLAFGHPRR